MECVKRVRCSGRVGIVRHRERLVKTNTSSFLPPIDSDSILGLLSQYMDDKTVTIPSTERALMARDGNDKDSKADRRLGLGSEFEFSFSYIPETLGYTFTFKRGCVGKEQEGAGDKAIELSGRPAKKRKTDAAPGNVDDSVDRFNN